jgi:hypothetical protein
VNDGWLGNKNTECDFTNLTKPGQPNLELHVTGINSTIALYTAIKASALMTMQAHVQHAFDRIRNKATCELAYERHPTCRVTSRAVAPRPERPPP